MCVSPMAESSESIGKQRTDKGYWQRCKWKRTRCCGRDESIASEEGGLRPSGVIQFKGWLSVEVDKRVICMAVPVLRRAEIESFHTRGAKLMCESVVASLSFPLVATQEDDPLFTCDFHPRGFFFFIYSSRKIRQMMNFPRNYFRFLSSRNNRRGVG